MSPHVRFEPIGEQIECAPGETILDAAFRHGYNLVYGCREGQCSACKCFLLEGDVALKRYSSFALSDSERSSGYSLMCRAMPDEDVVLELLHYDPDGYRLEHAIRDWWGTVEAIEPVTEDIIRVVVQTPQEFDFTPGQYLDLWVPGDSGARRSFSMANLPGEGRAELLIKRYPGGRLSGMLGAEIVEGSPLRFTGPYGSLRFRDSQRPVLMIAGGSGMAPILALLRQLSAERCRRAVRFFYGARAERDLFWVEEISALGARLADFRFTPVVGRFVHEAIDEYLAGPDGPASPDVYMCGPPAMVEAAEEMLVETHGIDEQRIFVDKFTTSAQAVPPGRTSDSAREFAWYEPAGRRATLYEDVTVDTQPSVHRHLTRGWPVSFGDGRGTWDDGSTALACCDWFAFRDPAEQWERPFYQHGSATEQQIDAAVRAAAGEGLLADFSEDWVEFLRAYLQVPAYVEHGLWLALATIARDCLSDSVSTCVCLQAAMKQRSADRALRDGPRAPPRPVPGRERPTSVPGGRALAADAAVPRAARRDHRLGTGADRRESLLRAGGRDSASSRAGNPRRRRQRRHGDAGAGAGGESGVGVDSIVDHGIGSTVDRRSRARRRQSRPDRPMGERLAAAGDERRARARAARPARGPGRAVPPIG
jgi:propane monooxygenase reductase component